VNPADRKYRSGAYRQFMPLTFPWIPGLDAAGMVEAVGANGKDFRPGQAVHGPVTASNAQYAVAPATDLAPKPEELSFDEAAS
jgi:NADPH:quinone reductase-like Zn-dependent oxidoreductase